MVSVEDLEDLLVAGIHAPSGSNAQNQRFLVLTEPEHLRRLGSLRFVWPYRSAGQVGTREKHPAGLIGEAPAAIVVFADAALNDARGNGEYHVWERHEIQNCAAAMQNILIAACAKGLGACWISASDRMSYTRLMGNQPWRTALADHDVPASWKLQGIILVGHPREVDGDGFAQGERMHGATEWLPTQRGPLAQYVLEPFTGHARASLRPGPLARFQIGCARRGIALCLGLVHALDRIIHRAEQGVLRG